MTLPKDPTKQEEYRRKLSIANKGDKSPNYGKHFSEEHRRKIGDAQRGEKNHLFGKHHTDKARKKMSEYRKGRAIHTDESRKKISDAHKGKYLSIETRMRMSESAKNKASETEETKRKKSESHVGKKRSPFTEEHRKHISASSIGKYISPETRKKLSEILSGEGNPFFGKQHSEESRLKICENHLEGFWYGNVRYYDGKYYCDLWTPEFRERVRAFFNYQCTECGTPQNGRKHCVHHVHYDKNVCCKNNEEIRDRKFVSLCGSCHTKTNHNRDYWEQHFTQIINDKYGGQCYLPKVGA